MLKIANTGGTADIKGRVLWGNDQLSLKEEVQTSVPSKTIDEKCSLD